MRKLFEHWMETALKEAAQSGIDIPVGCVLVSSSGDVIAQTCNSREADGTLLGHAETNAVLEAWGSPEFGELGGATLVTTLEPCIFCAAIIRETGISRVIYGANNSQRGAAGSVYDLLRDRRLGPPIEVIGGVLSQPCQQLLDRFFEQIRSSKL